jgi:opacity protein-like surface antigen
MRSRLYAFLALVTLITPSICSATPPRPGPYVGGFAGITIPYDSVTSSEVSGINDRIEFDPSVNIGATGGFDFGFLRTEGELSYKQAEMSAVTIRNTIPSQRVSDVDGRIGVLAMMGNVFLDLRNPGPITPYFGGGVGFAALHQSKTYSSAGRLYRDDDDAVFAYQVGGGLELAINRMISLDLGYRYFRTSEATFNQGDPVFENRLRFESHNFAAGVRIKF